MESSGQQFESSLVNAYAGALSKTKSGGGELMKDMVKYSGSMKEENLEGGLADKMSLGDIAVKHKVDIEELTHQFLKGLETEMKEHSRDVSTASEIALDHLTEDPKYYDKLSKIEKDFGTSAKKQFSKDLQDDPDYIDFKKRSKFKDGNVELSFGTPNVTGDDLYISKRKYSRVGKEETKEATGTGSSGAFEGPLFGGDQKFLKKSESETPKLKESYKRKPFASSRKEVKSGTNSEDVTFRVGDIVRPIDRTHDVEIKFLVKDGNRIMAMYKPEGQFSFEEIDIEGLIPVQSKKIPKMKAKKIKEQAEKVEATEATGSGSVGGYETPAMWAKSTKKKDWGPSRKTQIPGGSFVSVKKKCTKFPYCNQGDIKALNIYKNESVKEAISNISKKLNLSETTIKAIIEYELEKINKR